MQQKIGKEGIKVTFIQTLPGMEIQVAHQLVQACRAAGVNRYAFFKALGGCDIIMVYPSNYFGFQLTKYGIISGILKYNTFLCFPYRWTDSPDRPTDAIKFLNQSTFAGFSLLKMNSEGETSFQNIEEHFFSFLNRRHPIDSLTLGTLGWNELVLILTEESLGQIIEDLIRLSYEASLNPETSYPLIKTFSYLAINYDQLFGHGWSAKIAKMVSPKEFEDFFKKSLKEQKFGELIREESEAHAMHHHPPRSATPNYKGLLAK